jgi:uncharacterized protein with PIN domain
MSLTEERLSELMKDQTDVMIRKLLTQEKRAGEMTLEEIEEAVLEAGRRFQVVLTEALIESAEVETDKVLPLCPECEGKMRHKGYRDKPLVTQAGEVILRRAYFRCQSCGRGVFSPG